MKTSSKPYFWGDDTVGEETSLITECFARVCLAVSLHNDYSKLVIKH